MYMYINTPPHCCHLTVPTTVSSSSSLSCGGIRHAHCVIVVMVVAVLVVVVVPPLVIPIVIPLLIIPIVIPLLVIPVIIPVLVPLIGQGGGGGGVAPVVMPLVLPIPLVVAPITVLSSSMCHRGIGHGRHVAIIVMSTQGRGWW